MKEKELIPHLFRTEFRKITSVLTRLLGIEYLEVAEDIVSETFLSALEVWSYKGIPENPTAWLYSVAKNKAKNQLVRNKVFAAKVSPAIRASLEKEIPEIDLSEQNIQDSQLQMMFALCHPSIPQEAQVGLCLRILCGFGLDEIANAFLTNKENINKRLTRAREKLRIEKVEIEFPGNENILLRLNTVLTTLYLLFNEGYYSESNETIIREDLCLEAIRLTHLLIENETTDLSSVNALMALMCFHASRLRARKNEVGEMILYEDQDERLWDYELIAEGSYYLHKASNGNTISKYHLEAGIAYWHTIKNDTLEKWNSVLQLYNHLLTLEYSPLAALNRTYALAKVQGNEAAIKEAEKLQLCDNHYYYVLLGKLYKQVDRMKAKENYEKALSLSNTNTERNSILKQMNEF